ncbi:MAG: tRNA (N6-isopentenyl adenosine(37)-C2)-methylthiotransferase MiaB [Magnetococcales bacterium]|nr:tRNA (N6-isopentenyl adenosine(37)-C2)-methylthiotransferase MiaB [Magnetococcales bacterium]
MKNRFHIKTFGCQMNTYDSVRMAELLNGTGIYESVDDPAHADLIIFNTCHIREKAEDKLFSELGRMRKSLKGRDVRFAVGGCVAQAEGYQIFRRAPFVDLVFGPQNYHRLPRLLQRLEAGESRICDDAEHAESKFEALPDTRTGGPIASVAVQEGCDKFCAFCVVPFTRGREWSRPVDEILAEVTELARGGTREIHLLGQNVNAYKAMDGDGVDHDLALLIRQVALIDGIDRIRFVTSHPVDMNEDLVEVFGDVPELCAYLHLPIQSGSNRVLDGMERGHDVDAYRHWVKRLRETSPDIALASDFIVGFPGEDEAAFEETLAFVEEIGFDHAYSFKYSSRPGTPAAEMEHAVEESVKTERLARLQAVLNRHQEMKNKAQVGKIESVLVEGVSRRHSGEIMGRTSGMRTVNFAGSESLIGKIVSVQLTEGRANSLRGCLIDEECDRLDAE